MKFTTSVDADQSFMIDRTDTTLDLSYISRELIRKTFLYSFYLEKLFEKGEPHTPSSYPEGRRVADSGACKWWWCVLCNITALMMRIVFFNFFHFFHFFFHYFLVVRLVWCYLWCTVWMVIITFNVLQQINNI